MLNSMMEHYYCIEIQHNLTKNEYTHGKYQRQCGPIFKSLLNLLQYCLFYVCFFFFFFCYEAYLSCPTRDRTCTPCIGRWNLNHWTTREVPNFYLFLITTFINLKSVFKTHKWMWRSTHIKFALHLLSFKVSFVTKLSCSPSISQKLHKSLQSKLWITFWTEPIMCTIYEPESCSGGCAEKQWSEIWAIIKKWMTFYQSHGYKIQHFLLVANNLDNNWKKWRSVNTY